MAAGLDQDQMQRDNTSLMAELQETRDRIHKLQREGKVEAAELADTVESANKENLAMQSTVKELTQKRQTIEAVYKEGIKRDEELRRAKETFATKCSQVESLQPQLELTSLVLAREREGQARRSKNILDFLRIF